MYGKHFAQTYTGSMYGAGPVVFAVWGYVIANTRRDGTVELNAAMLASTLGATVDDVEKAIAVLSSPDPKSRTKAHDGRRLLKRGEFAYDVPSYQRFNSMRNDEERREYNRTKQQEHRAKKKAVNASVNNGQPPSAHIPIPIPTTTTRTRTTTTTAPSASTWLTPICDVYERHFGAGSFPYGQAAKTFKPLRDAGFSSEEIASRFDRYAAGLDDVRYLSLAKFRQTFGAFADGAGQKQGTKRNAGAQMVANIMGGRDD